MSGIYYERRQRESLAMMAATADPSCERLIHKRLAFEYGKLVDVDRLTNAVDVTNPFAAGGTEIPANDGRAAIRRAS